MIKGETLEAIPDILLDRRAGRPQRTWSTSRPAADAASAGGAFSDGTSVTVDPDRATCRKLAKAGAVRIRWPADPTRDVPEPETFSWHIFQKELWRKDAHLGWRYSEGELQKRAEAAAAAAPPPPPPKRRKCPEFNFR